MTEILDEPPSIMSMLSSIKRETRERANELCDSIEAKHDLKTDPKWVQLRYILAKCCLDQ